MALKLIHTSPSAIYFRPTSLILWQTYFWIEFYRDFLILNHIYLSIICSIRFIIFHIRSGIIHFQMIISFRQFAHLKTNIVFANAIGKRVKDIMVYNKGNLMILISDVYINISYGAVTFHILRYRVFVNFI